ncbi:MAG: helix-turn-helix domain-containing protein [Magnetospirillum sp.]|nr:helix-turn-helix domain-containing protein [Magnetospirillum sp.]
MHVGGRIRLRRTLMGLSQGQLGGAIGLTFQQVQKYERGANRVSASVLYRVAQVLDVPVSFFFDALPEGMGAWPPSGADDALVRRESLELLRHYYRLAGGERRQVYALVKAMARAAGDGAGDGVE